MADTHEHVNLELVDAGEHTDRVIQVLSKVNGLSMSPEDLIKSAPCIIAENVPRQMAEKLQTFLEKAGAIIELKENVEEEEEFELELDDGPDEVEEGDEEEWLTSEAISGPEATEEEENLFSPDDFPVAEDSHEEDLLGEPAMPEQNTDDEPGGDWILDDSSHAGEDDSDDGPGGPSDDFGGFSAAAPASNEDEDEDEDEDIFGDEDGLFDDDETEDEDFAAEEEVEEVPKKKFAIPFLSKKAGAEDEADKSSDDESENGGEGNASAFPVGLLVPALIGFVIGALLLGVWGMMSKSSLKKELQNTRSQNQNQSQIESQNAQLQQKVQQQTQEIESLKQQVADAGTQGDRTVTPQSISPSPVPDSESAQVLAAVLSSFETLKNSHIEKLGQSYETQKQASCAQQVLLDGEGTLTYAQVVKKFSTKYTAFDVMRSNSLVTPFVAELKIPFKQEMRIGANEKACNAGALKELPTPKHHEFGNFYGIWIIEYQYKDGKWMKKSTVQERNRALYEKAFKVGSPDYAKFLIDDKLYPGFKN